MACEAMVVPDFAWQDKMDNLIAHLATANKDTSHHHDAMKDPDANEFVRAMIKKLNLMKRMNTSCKCKEQKHLKAQKF